jgi:hypothetical protein
MPVRYTSPSLGTNDNSYLSDHQWELGLGYRWLQASNYFIGQDNRPAASLNGEPIDIKVHTLDLNLTYAFTSRFSVRLAVPLSFASASLVQNDLHRHTWAANGLGDVSLVGTAWLLQPLEHPYGNIALGLGVKAPTGSNSARDSFYVASGQAKYVTVDNSIQPGDGGWGIILQMNAFQRVLNRLSAYATGYYLVNPRVHTNVRGGSPNPGSFGISGVPINPPGVNNFVSVPDEYSAHAGLSYALWPRKSLALTLGGRIDGVPADDVIGGGDVYFRRPGYVVYVEPGVSLTLAKGPFNTAGSTLALSVPVALSRNRQWSVQERKIGQNLGGDLSQYSVFFGYSLRL